MFPLKKWSDKIQISQATEFIEQYRRNWKEHIDKRILIGFQISKIPTKRENKSEIMEQFYFLVSVTSLIRSDTGNDYGAGNDEKEIEGASYRRGATVQ